MGLGSRGAESSGLFPFSRVLRGILIKLQQVLSGQEDIDGIFQVTQLSPGHHGLGDVYPAR